MLLNTIYTFNSREKVGIYENRLHNDKSKKEGEEDKNDDSSSSNSSSSDNDEVTDY